MGIKTFDVKEGNREMKVIIPETGDKVWDAELELAEREKTRDQLRTNQRPVSKVNKKEVGEALKDLKDFYNAKRENRRRIY